MARSRIPGKIRNTTRYHNAGPLGFSNVEKCLRMPGVLAYALESTQAGNSAKMQLIIMTTGVGSILFIFQKYRIWTIDAKIHDATKVIQRALLPSCLGRGSAIPETMTKPLQLGFQGI
ncbi:MAG: hypothetical protein AMJ75_00020 [Phycisphaerae bacterium SM1_79]|nr:MAG: hypothetical protein AMJ75_00020 [Phycisphaerae bacterium SM1_79]